jgi:hypothetical protein
MQPKILKGLSLGLSFEFEFEYFSNLLQLSKKIIQNIKKNYFLSMDQIVSILKIRKKLKLILKSILKKYSFFLYFKLSFSKFARDLQNTQTQNSNTQKIENSSPNLNL